MDVTLPRAGAMQSWLEFLAPQQPYVPFNFHTRQDVSSSFNFPLLYAHSPPNFTHTDFLTMVRC